MCAKNVINGDKNVHRPSSRPPNTPDKDRVSYEEKLSLVCYHLYEMQEATAEALRIAVSVDASYVNFRKRLSNAVQEGILDVDQRRKRGSYVNYYSLSARAREEFTTKIAATESE